MCGCGSARPRIYSYINFVHQAGSSTLCAAVVLQGPESTRISYETFYGISVTQNAVQGFFVGVAVNLNRRPAALYPQEYSWYSFLLEAESTPGP
jgi:hypothetical protein